METLDQAMREMDFNFFSSGEHSMSVEAMRKALNNDHFIFLDVRTDREIGYLSFPFALHIPVDQLPDRIGELPKDKCIVAYCSSIFRAAVVYTYLKAKGFDEVKGLTASLEDLVQIFKPKTTCDHVKKAV